MTGVYTLFVAPTIRIACLLAALLSCRPTFNPQHNIDNEQEIMQGNSGAQDAKRVGH